MKPSELPANRERDPVPPSRLTTIRLTLQAMVNQLADDDSVYVNGLTFNADEFRFMLSCLKEPKAQ